MPNNVKQIPTNKGSQVADKVKSIDSQPFDNKNIRYKYIPSTPNDQIKEENSKQKEELPEESKIDAVLKLLAGHISKYNEDSKNAEARMNRIEENSKGIETNKELIDKQAEEIRRITETNKEQDKDIKKNEEEVIHIKEREANVAKRISELEARSELNKNNIERKSTEDETIIINTINEKFENVIKKPTEEMFKESDTYKDLVERISELERGSKENPAHKNQSENNGRRLEEFPPLNTRHSSRQEEQSTRGYKNSFAAQTSNTGAKPKLTGRYVDLAKVTEKNDVEVVAETFTQEKVEQMFAESATKIVFFPVTRSDITKWSWRTEEKNHEKDTDNKVFYSPEYREERLDQAYDICIGKYKFYESEVCIKDVQYCSKASSKMMIVTTTKEFAKSIFIRASEIKDRSINVFQHIPGPALNRKKKLDLLLASIRQKTPGLRTQVRLGKTDLKVMAKVQKQNDYSQYEEIPMSEIDPLDTLPGINLPGAKKPTNTGAVANLIRNFQKEIRPENVDKEGYRIVENKRKMSPEKEELRKKQKENTPEKIGERVVSRLEGTSNLEEPSTSTFADLLGATSLPVGHPVAAAPMPDTSLHHITPPKVHKQTSNEEEKSPKV